MLRASKKSLSSKGGLAILKSALGLEFEPRYIVSKKNQKGYKTL